MTKQILFLVFAASVLPPCPAPAQTNEAPPRELGTVRWLRSYPQAIARARRESKPILILFQEIPGCGTCVRYGRDVLAQPLIVETIESLFVPLAIHNNKPGADAEVLHAFREPPWNNPVVRIVAPDGAALAPRLAGDYTVGGMAGILIAALEKTGSAVPDELRALAAPRAPPGSARQK